MDIPSPDQTEGDGGMWETLGECPGYVIGEATIKAALPASHPVCKYCQPYVRYESAYDRYSCRITGEYLFSINKERGKLCPFRWEGEKGG